MTEKCINKIMEEVNKSSGYSIRHKIWLDEFLPTLHFDYSHRTICEDSQILPTVDRIMQRYERYNPIACTWHDIEPKPFDEDFMAGSLNDNEDMFIVLTDPLDSYNTLGIHIIMNYFGDIYFEINHATCDEENYISEEELIRLADSIVAKWNT